MSGHYESPEFRDELREEDRRDRAYAEAAEPRQYTVHLVWTMDLTVVAPGDMPEADVLDRAITHGIDELSYHVGELLDEEDCTITRVPLDPHPQGAVLDLTDDLPFE